jgi:hypothetical protein
VDKGTDMVMVMVTVTDMGTDMVMDTDMDTDITLMINQPRKNLSLDACLIRFNK